jgi:hypothetical protein
MWGEFVFDLMAPALVRSLCRFVDVMGGTPREWLLTTAASSLSSAAVTPCDSIRNCSPLPGPSKG